MFKFKDDLKLAQELMEELLTYHRVDKKDSYHYDLIINLFQNMYEEVEKYKLDDQRYVLLQIDSMRYVLKDYDKKISI